MKEEQHIFLAHVIDNYKVDENKESRVMLCEVVIEPSLNDPKFDSVETKDYVWEEREFAYPFLTHKKENEIFAIDIKTSKESTTICVASPEWVEKATVIYKKVREEMTKRFEELGKNLEDSGFFEKEEYRNEYEAYMKEVTDGFAELTSYNGAEGILAGDSHVAVSIYKNKEFLLEYDKDLKHMYRLESLDAMVKDFQAKRQEIAEQFLEKNKLSYFKWFKKFKKQDNGNNE